MTRHARPHHRELVAARTPGSETRNHHLGFPLSKVNVDWIQHLTGTVHRSKPRRVEDDNILRTNRVDRIESAVEERHRPSLRENSWRVAAQARIIGCAAGA